MPMGSTQFCGNEKYQEAQVQQDSVSTDKEELPRISPTKLVKSVALNGMKAIDSPKA